MVEGQHTTGDIRAEVVWLIRESGASTTKDNYCMVLDYCMTAGQVGTDQKCLLELDMGMAYSTDPTFNLWLALQVEGTLGLGNNTAPSAAGPSQCFNL